MESRGRIGTDLVGALAVIFIVGCAAVYLGLISKGDGDVAWWFLAGLAAAAFLAAYGATRGLRQRVRALAISAAILAVLGVLAIPSIGLLLIIAAALAVIAAVRAQREARGS